MLILCPKCQSKHHVKNGFVREQQRYKCTDFFYNFIQGDARNKYDNQIRNLAVRMYLNNCGFRRISEILNIPLATCFIWIRKAGRIVDEMVKERKEEPKDIKG